MAEKNIKSRIVHKHDLESNWLLATNFTPKQGELIVYDVDDNYSYERIKIGDGVQNVNNLPFVDDALRAKLVAQINDVDDKVDAVSILVGDTSVSDQINEAMINSQADWNQNDDTQVGFIKNKPILVGIAGTGANSEIFNYYTANSANGDYSHAEGYGTTADGNYAHAEGSSTTAKKESSHAEGESTVANGVGSHAEGYRTTTAGEAAHAEGYSGNKCPTTITYGTDNNTVIETWQTTSKFTLAKGRGSHAEGYNTLALGNYSHTEGSANIASGENSHAEGYTTVASGIRSHVEGYKATASGNNSHAEGEQTTASGNNSHAEGVQTTSMGYASHTEGYSTYKIPDTITSSTNNSTIIETHQTTPFTLAKGQGSHAEGYDTLAIGAYASHTEGRQTIATGNYSHAEGQDTVASGVRSHVEGYKTIAKSDNQHVQGKYNIEDANSLYAHIVGNGSSAARSNAHTIDWDGNAWFAGDVYVGGTSQDEGGKLVKQSELLEAVAVDNTLAIEGRAADAKATGDAIGALNALVGDTSVAEQISEATYTQTQVDELIAAVKQFCLPKIRSITLTESNWVFSANYYYQDVPVGACTPTSKVDLQPTYSQLATWQDDGLAFTTQSRDGIVRVWAIPDAPREDITVQISVQEVLGV